MLYYYLDKSVTTIGRSRRCDVVLPDSKVSARHAEIQREGGSVILYDLNSTNGTFVNGEKVVSHLLREGDRVRMGDTTFVYQAGALQQQSGPAAARGGAKPSRDVGPRYDYRAMPVSQPMSNTLPVILLGGLGLLVLVVALFAFLRPTGPTQPPVISPAGEIDKANQLAHAWVSGSLPTIAGQITNETSLHIPLESSVLETKILEQISQPAKWTYSTPVKVTEDTYHVAATANIGITVLGPPQHDYAITADYALTVDTSRSQVMNATLANVSVH